MKISKLFHWLYATLMFLPLLFLVPTLLYYGFNEHATNTETTTINYKYKSNEVNTLDDLVEGNIYYNDFLGIEEVNNFETYFQITLLSCEGCDYSFDSTLHDFDIYDLLFNNNQLILNVGVASGNFVYNLVFENEGTFIQIDLLDVEYINFNNITYTITNVEAFTNYITNFKVKYPSYDELPQYTDYNVIESVSVNTDDTITDKVATAWESIWNLPLFAWTQNSFVSAPFTYITGLFGLQANNSLNYVFTYFCSISICWLVFDLLMYVPNLAHRWLDRSSLQ